MVHGTATAISQCNLELKNTIFENRGEKLFHTLLSRTAQTIQGHFQVFQDAYEPY